VLAAAEQREIASARACRSVLSTSQVAAWALAVSCCSVAANTSQHTQLLIQLVPQQPTHCLHSSHLAGQPRRLLLCTAEQVEQLHPTSRHCLGLRMRPLQYVDNHLDDCTTLQQHFRRTRCIGLHCLDHRHQRSSSHIKVISGV
jgi:hypothetical protein